MNAREQIAAIICPGIYCETHGDCLDDADALMPLVDRLRAEAAAEALEEAAEELRENREDATAKVDPGDPWTYNEAYLSVRDRAAALRTGATQ